MDPRQVCCVLLLARPASRGAHHQPAPAHGMLIVNGERSGCPGFPPAFPDKTSFSRAPHPGSRLFCATPPSLFFRGGVRRRGRRIATDRCPYSLVGCDRVSNAPRKNLGCMPVLAAQVGPNSLEIPINRPSETIKKGILYADVGPAALGG